MARMVGKDSEVVKDKMFSRLGKTIRSEQQVMINNGVRSDTRNYRTKHGINFTVRPNVLSSTLSKKRPTTSFTSVNRKQTSQPVHIFL